MCASGGCLDVAPLCTSTRAPSFSRLAIAASALLRKTLPAMVVTLVGYLAARIPIDAWARPRYMPMLCHLGPIFYTNSA